MILASILSALLAQATPSVTEPPHCADPNREASVTNVVMSDAPPDLKEPVTALVEVVIGPSGNLVNATIYKSGGSISVDRAAIASARASTFSPKFVDCVPTTADYLFRAEFNPDGSTPQPLPTPAPTAPPPKFSPPLGWHGVRSFGNQWSDGKGNTLDFSATGRTDATLGHVYASAVSKKNKVLGPVQLVETEYIKACHGTQDALHMVYHLTGTGTISSDVRVTVRYGYLYVLVYRTASGTPPSIDALASMESFCAP